MRYAGQNYELSVPLPDGPIAAGTFDGLVRGFTEAHRQRYGFLAEGEPIQIVTLRLGATGLVRKAKLAEHPAGGPDAAHSILGRRNVWFPEAGGLVPTPVYDRERLRPGNELDGPCVVEQMDATTLVLPGMTARVDPWLNLILEARA
jgi:N-methylhydantoinase A